MREQGVLYRLRAVDNVSSVLNKVASNSRLADNRFNGMNNRIKSNNTSLSTFTDRANKSARSIENLGKSSSKLDGLKNKLKELASVKSIGNIGMPVMGDTLGGGGSSMMGMMGGARLLAGPLGLAAGGAGALAMGLNSVEKALGPTLAQFEKYEAVLSNTLGSDNMAKFVMNDIVKFASNTPQQVDELTESWVKLAGTGFKPSMNEMMKMADLANSTGKGIVQLTEAFLDAPVGEYIRLKEFNIQAKKMGDKVAFTFKNQTTMVDDNRAAINKYLLSLGDMKGVQGASTKIMQTHGGATSNLEDKTTQLKLALGNGLKPVLSAVVEAKSKLIDKLMLGANWFEINKSKIADYTSKGLTGLVSMLEGVGSAFAKLFNFLDENGSKIFEKLKPIMEFYQWQGRMTEKVGGFLFGRNEDEERAYLNKEKGRLTSKNSLLSSEIKNLSPGVIKHSKEYELNENTNDLQNINKKIAELDKKQFGKLQGNYGNQSWLKLADQREKDKLSNSIYGMDKTNSNTDKKTKDPIGTKLDDLVQGGKQTKNFYVTIDSLVKEQIINTTKLEEGANRIKDIIQEVLISAVRNTEVLEGSR